MKRRFFAFSVFLLIVVLCFSFLYLFPVLGSDSMKTAPSLKFKEWQIGRFYSNKQHRVVRERMDTDHGLGCPMSSNA